MKVYKGKNTFLGPFVPDKGGIHVSVYNIAFIILIDIIGS